MKGPEDRMVSTQGSPETLSLVTNRRDFEAIDARQTEGSPHGWRFQTLGRKEKHRGCLGSIANLSAPMLPPCFRLDISDVIGEQDSLQLFTSCSIQMKDDSKIIYLKVGTQLVGSLFLSVR